MKSNCFIIFYNIFCFSLILLSGCSAFYKCEPAERPKLAIENPAPLKLNDIILLTVTKENAEAKFAELEKKGLKPVMISLSGRDYKLLALNLDKIKNYILLLQDILTKYRAYYESSEEVPSARK